MKIMAREQRRHRFDTQFRAACFASDPIPLLSEIFGVDLRVLPEIRHGETIAV